MGWWWLSYADESNEFLGVIISPGDDFIEACQISSTMGLSPGGQVQGIPVNWGGECIITLSKTFRLLNRKEAVELSDLIDGQISGVKDWNTKRGVSTPVDTNPSRE